MRTVVFLELTICRRPILFEHNCTSEQSLSITQKVKRGNSTPKKTSPIKLVPTGDRTRARCVISDLVKNPDETDILIPVLNFGEVRSAQLAKSTLLTSMLVPLGSSQIF